MSRSLMNRTQIKWLGITIISLTMKVVQVNTLYKTPRVSDSMNSKSLSRCQETRTLLQHQPNLHSLSRIWLSLFNKSFNIILTRLWFQNGQESAFISQITPQKFEYDGKMYKLKVQKSIGSVVSDAINLSELRLQEVESHSNAFQHQSSSNFASHRTSTEEVGLQCDFGEEQLKVSPIAQPRQNQLGTFTNEMDYAEIQRQLALKIELEEEEEAKDLKSEVKKKIGEKKIKAEHPKVIEEQKQEFPERGSTVQKSNLKRDSTVQISSQLSDIGQKKGRKLKQAYSIEDFEKLQEENEELQRQLSAAFVNKLNYIDHHNVADTSLHLAFLYASPLGYLQHQNDQMKDLLKVMTLLDFHNEFNKIRASIQAKQKLVRVKSTVATFDSLTKILVSGPLALHFSGHGLPYKPSDAKPPEEKKSVAKLVNDIKAPTELKGYLLFEKENGEGELISDDSLKQQIEKTNANIEFVFVASCTSEFAGEIFLKAGAKHVICVKQGQKILDESIINFAQLFYSSLFSSEVTICNSFDLAKEAIKIRFGDIEEQKFTLLPRDLKEQNHKCKMFGPLHTGEATFETIKVRVVDIPARVQNLIGRQKELFNLALDIQANRLVTIIGLPGIGKTALAKNVSHYFSARTMFNAGIIFISAKGLTDSDIVVRQLLEKLQTVYNQKAKKLSRLMNSLSSENILELCLKEINDTEESFLLVIDNAEELLRKDKQEFFDYLNYFLNLCPKFHILVTSHQRLGALQSERESLFTLKELDQISAYDLFFYHGQPSTEHLLQLINIKIEDYLPQTSIATMMHPYRHKFFTDFYGNPQAIILASTLLSQYTLKELFYLFASQEMTEVLKADGIQNNQVKCLRVSLEAILQVLENEDSESLELFYFLGLLPGGIDIGQLDDLFLPGWESCEKKLEEFSLVVRKESKTSTSLSLPPFILSLAEAKIPDELKIPFQSDICFYYQKICKGILDENNVKVRGCKQKNTTAHNNSITKKLLVHEQNIIACLSRLIIQSEKDEELKVQLQNANRSTTRQLHEDIQNNLRRQNSDGILDLKEHDYLRFEQNNLIEEEEEKYTSEHNLQSESKQDIKRLRKAIQIEEEDLEEAKEIAHIGNAGDLIRQSTQHVMADQQMKPVFFRKFSKFQKQISSLFQAELFAQKSVMRKVDTQHSDDSIGTSESLKDDNEPEDQSSKNRYQERELQKLMRDSNVNFQRKNQINSTILENIKLVEEVQSPSKYKRGATLLSKRSHAYLIQQKQFQQNSKQKNSECLHVAEQLILQYIINLFLIKYYDNALKFIREIASKVKGSLLFEANVKRIEGLIWNQKNDYKKSVGLLKEAKQLYYQLSSIYGLALSNFSIGYVYMSNKEDMLVKLSCDKIYRVAKIFIQNSLKQFIEINHVMGMTQCYMKLAEITGFQKQVRESNQMFEESQFCKGIYHQMRKEKTWPFSPRIQGKDTSIMIELVLDTQNKDLYQKHPDQESRTKLKKFTQSLGQLVQCQYLSMNEENIDDKEVKEVEDQLDAISILIAPDIIQKVQIEFMNGAKIEENSKRLDSAQIKEKRKRIWNSLEKRKIKLKKKCIMVAVKVKQSMSNKLGSLALNYSSQQNVLSACPSSEQLIEENEAEFSNMFGNLLSQKVSPVKRSSHKIPESMRREEMKKEVNALFRH